MKNYEFTLRTSGRSDFVGINSEVQLAVKESGVKNGICVIFIPHTTAGITINEGADPDVVRDIKASLDRIVPWEAGYAHSEGNSAAHIKASMMGSSCIVFIENGSISLGTWQKIYFCEFDGPRTRKVRLKINGE